MSTITKWWGRILDGRRPPDPSSCPDQRLPNDGVLASPTCIHDFSIVSCARWEEAHAQEWIEYHRAIGFSHIYLYSNDDDPTLLFRAVAPYTYGPNPFVTFLHWPRRGAQIEIYLHFLSTFKTETRWFSFLDIDEFFVLKDIDNICNFMKEYESNVDCLYFHWVLYGNSDKLKREDGPTLTSYLRRAREPDVHTKMLCRSTSIDPAAIEGKGHGAFWHFIDNYKLPGVRCTDVFLEIMDGYSAKFPESALRFVKRAGFADAVLKRAYVAHFQFRSEEDFLRRWRRGGFAQDDSMWRAMFETGKYKSILADRNRVYDVYLAAFWHRHTMNSMQVGMTERNQSRAKNVALNKPSWQSSVYSPTAAEPELSSCAGRGNNGVRTGTYGFHTNEEMRPWWIVDLLDTHRIDAIYIYNRCDDPAVSVRANSLDVLCSADGEDWRTVWSNPDASAFGFNGSPLVISPPRHLRCRFVLLQLRVRNYLHLDEIEVYGSAVDPTVTVKLPEGGPIIRK